ncbi:MAG: CBS domain-containing protein [Ignavibacteria bacterium]|jgi:CBS domain-containing protein|nr:CBS domain-containing protein [Ignavibacteria bacterium]MCU7505135.1 CBS domain-containing protein [Ignavibacteria bacterium]MCU7518013.1 CBS domain-containing protein [Ignavibacteria bacterium]
MTIKDVMTPHVEIIKPEISVTEAAQKMKSLDCGILPVYENDKLIGMITDRDIAIRSTAEGHDPKADKVRDIMTKKVVYCYDDEPVEKMAETMEKNKIRRLIILNRQKRLVGICSLGDLVLASRNKQLSGEVLEKVSEHS